MAKGKKLGFVRMVTYAIVGSIIMSFVLVIVTPFMSFVIIVGIGLIFLLLSTNSFIKTDFSKINRSSSDASDLWG